MVGAIYLVLMTVTATAAIFIRDLRDGSFSFLHLFVLLTYWSVFSAIWNRVKPIPSWNSPRLLMAYAAFFFDVVVSIFSSRFIASRSLGRCR